MVKIYKFIRSLVICKGVKVGFILREEHSFRTFENVRPRRIFAPKWDEVMGG
jgi:hypothetical protein